MDAYKSLCYSIIIIITIFNEEEKIRKAVLALIPALINVFSDRIDTRKMFGSVQMYLFLLSTMKRIVGILRYAKN